MHVGCYFHHTVLSGVIVVPAPSAQIAACSHIAVAVSTLTLCPLLLPRRVLFCLGMEMELQDPVGSINRSRLQSCVDPGFGGEGRGFGTSSRLL